MRYLPLSYPAAAVKPRVECGGHSRADLATFHPTQSDKIGTKRGAHSPLIPMALPHFATLNPQRPTSGRVICTHYEKILI